MRRNNLRKLVLAALVVHAAASSCVAQSNVYSAGIYAGGITYYPSHWVIGSPPFQFGLEEYSYSTDAAGFIIMYSPDRRAQAGDTYHRRTRILLGPFSVSAPFRPPGLAALAGGVVLLAGALLFSLRPGAHKSRAEELRESQA